MEADSNFNFVNQFTDAVRAKALSDVLARLTPGQQFVQDRLDELC